MATTFEIIIDHPDARYAGQAAYAAFELTDRLEQDLSRYIENSDISRINAAEPGTPVPVGQAAMDCLRLSRRVWKQTGGTFDPTIGLLLERYRGPWKDIRPGDAEIAKIREQIGMDKIAMDEQRQTVARTTGAARLDLGGIGKGYAVDRMMALLDEWDCPAALLHGGYSSVFAGDAPSGQKGWPLRIAHPRNPSRNLARFSPVRRALSASGLRRGFHIIDPRTGRLVKEQRAAWALAKTAAEADALSTAFMVTSLDTVERYCKERPGVSALAVANLDGPQPETIRFFGEPLL
jgi:thiamine biosynthesis lipoprotein